MFSLHFPGPGSDEMLCYGGGDATDVFTAHYNVDTLLECIVNYGRYVGIVTNKTPQGFAAGIASCGPVGVRDGVWG
jgi:hypothetical protein